MQLEVGKSDTCYKGEAQEAVGLEVETSSSLRTVGKVPEEVTVKLSPRRCVSNEEELVHRGGRRPRRLSPDRKEGSARR